MRATIPAQVLMPADAAAIDILEYFERDIYWDLSSNTLHDSAEFRTGLERWTAKRGDVERVALRLISRRADGTTKRIVLPAECSVFFSALPKDGFGQAAVTSAELVLDETDAEDPKYVGLIRWDTESCNAALDFGQVPELKTVTLSADFEIEEVDELTEEVIARGSCLTIPITLNNDCRRSGQQTSPTAGDLRSGYDYRWDITALTGGAAGALDALPTAAAPAGKCVIGIDEGGRVRDWRLETDPNPGVTVEDAVAGIVIPDDYDAEDNAKIWVRKR